MQTHYEFSGNTYRPLARMKIIKIALQNVLKFGQDVQTLKSRISLAHKVKVERLSMQKLTDTELRDLGIHRADAERESGRGFFDIPKNRD